MAKEPTDIGTNRTGISLSPVHSKELIDGALNAVPSSEGDEQDLANLRNTYSKEGIPVGTMPVPATLKGAAMTVLENVKGTTPTVFLDKLGERLAFERTGTRLYEALIAKVEALGEDPTKSGQKLREIHDEEAAHFELLNKTIKELGADPTAMTPCADIAGVTSMGLLQVLTDPRTTVTQSLDAILIAELADTEGWTMLIKLADEMGQKKLVERFTECHLREQEHLAFVKALLTELTIAEASGKRAH